MYDDRKLEGAFSNMINNAVHALDNQSKINITITSDKEL